MKENLNICEPFVKGELTDRLTNASVNNAASSAPPPSPPEVCEGMKSAVNDDVYKSELQIINAL